MRDARGPDYCPENVNVAIGLKPASHVESQKSRKIDPANLEVAGTYTDRFVTTTQVTAVDKTV